MLDEDKLIEEVVTALPGGYYMPFFPINQSVAEYLIKAIKEHYRQEHIALIKTINEELEAYIDEYEDAWVRLDSVEDMIRSVR